MKVAHAFIGLLWSSAVSGLYVRGTNSSGPIVELPYARYEGFHNQTTGLDVFLGIRYASAPTGTLRWRAPKTPKRSIGTLLATSEPAKCFQLVLPGGSNVSTPGVPGPSEDCLFLNVFSPPPTSQKKKLPVLVWVHGGGYFGGFAAEHDPTAMIQASNNSFVAVIIQYRLGMFGFLPGTQVKKHGDLNAGLLDVQFALEWTRQNIHLWGGDPGAVTLWGESAGAGAVLMQVVANGGKTNPQLFKRAIASSPYVPPNYQYNDPQAEAEYSSFVSNAGHNADEGFTFITQDSNGTVLSYLQGQLPKLSKQNRTAIASAYEVFTNSNASAEANTFAVRVAVFSEAVFVCPSLWLVEAFPKRGYQGLFAIPPAYHSEDVGVYFPGIPAAPPAQPFTESVTQSFMGALVSFILTGSPNNNPLNKTINPNWNMYDSTKPQGMTFNITASGIADPKFEAVNSGVLDRCK
ncbi:hypothetical protein FRC10_007076 [Ceratobasidium sp. 414]|nr:hypothetical protein FRC10_007076 [Ceratobasidium sp. 414]